MHNHRVSLLLVSAAALGFVTSRSAWADDGPSPVACFSRGVIWPTSGDTLPANVPAVLFVPPEYNPAKGIPTRTIATFGIEFRDGSGEIVPTSIEAVGPNDLGLRVYVVRPKRALVVGPTVLSFLDDCPQNGGYSLLNPPIRRERRYQVVPAVPLPTTLGTATLPPIYYSEFTPSCHRPNSATARIEVQPSPEAFAFRNLLIFESRFGGSRQDGWYDVARNLFVAYHSVSYKSDQLAGILSGEARTLDLRAVIPGVATSIDPARVSVTLDWSDRPSDAGPSFCDLPPATNGGGEPHGAEPPGNGGRAEAGVPDSRGAIADGGASSPGISDGGSIPDAYTSARAEPARDGSAAIAGAAPSQAEGCACSVGSPGHRGDAQGLLMVGVMLFGRMTRSSRLRRGHGRASVNGGGDVAWVAR